MGAVTGIVTCVTVVVQPLGGNVGGAVEIRDSSGTLEFFPLWDGSLDAFWPGVQVTYNMWVYLLKQSLVSSVPVTIDTPATSNLVASVIFG